MEVVTLAGHRYPVDMGTLNADYGGDLQAYVDVEITPQTEWWME